MAVATYQYWIPMTDVEHYLYATEIAQSLNIITKAGSFAGRFVTTYCNNLIEEKGWIKTYYKTKNNTFKQVFHPSFIEYVATAFDGNDTVEVTDNATGIKYKAFKDKVTDR